MESFFISVSYLILDSIWIYLMTPLLYSKVFSKIQKYPMKANIRYAIFAYIVLLIVIFKICVPLSETYKERPWLAFALVGFCIYSIFNLTNGTIFKDYSLQMTIVDSIWGCFVFGIIGILYTKHIFLLK